MVRSSATSYHHGRSCELQATIPSGNLERPWGARPRGLMKLREISIIGSLCGPSGRVFLFVQDSRARWRKSPKHGSSRATRKRTRERALALRGGCARKGLIPAVIYGHKQAVVPVTLTRDDVWRMIKTPGHLADLDVNGTAETVLIRDIQWDHLGKEVLHLDFARVSAEELIDTEVSFEVRGIPAGLAAGGILEHLVHSVKITCKAGAIPESIKADVSQLQVGEGIHVRDLVLAAGRHDQPRCRLAARPRRRPGRARGRETGGRRGRGRGRRQPEVIKPERKEKEKET